MALYTLYPFQQDAINNLNLIAEEVKEFGTMVAIPTGGGKTLTAEVFIIDTILPKGTKVLWFANSQYLVSQATECMKKLDNGVIVSEVVAGTKIWDYPKDTQFMAMTWQYAIRHIDELKEFYKNEDILIVVDEAHHSCANSYVTLIEQVPVLAKSCSLLGLTATPFRTDMEETPHLHKLYPDGVTNGVIDDSSIAYSIGLKDLISMGYLAIPKLFRYNINCNLDMKLSGVEEEDIHIIEKTLTADVVFNKSIVDIFISEKDRFGKTIIFAIGRQHAITLWQMLVKRGINASIAISGDVPEYNINPQTTEDNIESFRTAEGADVLITCKMLNEGFDVPETKSVILTKPLISKIACTQCIGRALRKKDDDNVANIVYFNTSIKGCEINWVMPEEIVGGAYKLCKLSDSNALNDTLDNIKEYIENFIKQSDTIETANLITNIVSQLEGFYLYKDTAGIIHQTLVYVGNHACFKKFLSKLGDDELEDNLGDFLCGGDDSIPLDSTELLGIVAHYKQTGQLPTYYANDDVVNGLLDLKSKAVAIEDCSMREGKAMLTELWGKELILQYRYFDVADYINKVVSYL